MDFPNCCHSVRQRRSEESVREHEIDCLGHRVLTKLTALIRSEMNQVGGQELFLSSIGRKNVWESNGENAVVRHSISTDSSSLDRWNLMHKELFKFKDHDEEYCLSPVRISPL